MKLPDLNLLVHAYNTDSPHHRASRTWWKNQMEQPASLAFAWVVLLGFVRITTHRRILESPFSVSKATSIVRSWLDRQQTFVLHPGERHAEILFGLLEQVGSAGNLTTDAHLAAIALEHGAEIQTTDADFARFEGVRWRNPLRD